MGKVIKFPNIPHLSEDRALEILSNVSAVACMPEPRSILNDCMYLAYREQRRIMSAEDLVAIGFNRANEFEEAYLSEKGEANA